MAAAPRAAGPPWLVPGLQLGAAVLLAYGLSMLARLPEGLWAVMSALLVARPHTGAALAAGWERVKGTLLGCAAGMLSIWINPHGGSLPLLGLSLVALLAFASAARPGWRSAPIAALIVLSGSALAGATPLHVAGLRVIEVGLGVVAGMAVSFLDPATRSAVLFDAALAAMLGRLAQQMRELGTAEARTREEKEAAATEQRTSLRQLGELALGAERVRRLFRRKVEGARVDPHRRQTALMGRIAQDVGLFGRSFESLPGAADAAQWAELARCGSTALDAVAAALAQPGALPPASLDQLATLRRPGSPLDLPVAWLADDLRTLLRLRAA